MKRIKIPSLASMQLDDSSRRRTTPAGEYAWPILQRLRESFSFITRTPALFNSFITVPVRLPGYNYLIKDIGARRKLMFT